MQFLSSHVEAHLIYSPLGHLKLEWQQINIYMNNNSLAMPFFCTDSFGLPTNKLKQIANEHPTHTSRGPPWLVLS
jgi:hypothetical protein